MRNARGAATRPSKPPVTSREEQPDAKDDTLGDPGLVVAEEAVLVVVREVADPRRDRCIG